MMGVDPYKINKIIVLGIYYKFVLEIQHANIDGTFNIRSGIVLIYAVRVSQTNHSRTYNGRANIIYCENFTLAVVSLGYIIRNYSKIKTISLLLDSKFILC
ncbi:MAG: hypothetical protein PSX42_22655 [bacterium]|nr:hypothetical protein [bacterium]